MPTPERPLRRLRFFILEKLVLPVAIIPFRLLIRTWRKHGPDEAALHVMMQAPRVILATYHGMVLHLLAFSDIVAPYGRRLVVMVSPSLDGRLLAAAFKHFGITHVWGTSGNRAVAGSFEFIERVRAGDVGVVAADGPCGPCCVAKPGVLRIAAAADAHLTLTVTTAGRGIHFGSWDRAHLPGPFARVQMSFQLLPPPIKGDIERTLPAIQAALLDTARRLRSPVLPPD